MSVQELKIEKPKNDLVQLMQLGDEAGKIGLLQESLTWYTKGLAKARDLKNEVMMEKFSSLVMLSL
ncbi:MAG: hypothetical protein COA33_000430 [Fluviicola sp.]|nr:hypothetical protein [Fluviicola sp.]